MIKKLPIPVETEESEFNQQFHGWLNDSHYWIEKKINGVTLFQCKWCNNFQPNCSTQSYLCMENPEIKNISR